MISSSNLTTHRSQWLHTKKNSKLKQYLQYSQQNNHAWLKTSFVACSRTTMYSDTTDMWFRESWDCVLLPQRTEAFSSGASKSIGFRWGTYGWENNPWLVRPSASVTELDSVLSEDDESRTTSSRDGSHTSSATTLLTSFSPTLASCSDGTSTVHKSIFSSDEYGVWTTSVSPKESDRNSWFCNYTNRKSSFHARTWTSSKP